MIEIFTIDMQIKIKHFFIERDFKHKIKLKYSENTSGVQCSKIDDVDLLCY